ncbi:hypothetical protein AURDEDRAFT_176214 [Auricularia subglabra TFB-10046 SS5]|nr:hypothetical protein AURDEDRAFT_176214 [Auricularia subglabra TFB-10046 SS5]
MSPPDSMAALVLTGACPVSPPASYEVSDVLRASLSFDRIATAITPYPRLSTWLFNKHHWSFDSHSKEDRRALVHDVLLHKLFEPEGLKGISTAALDDGLRHWDVADPLLSPDQNGIAVRCDL